MTASIPDQIDAITERHPDYHRSPEALKEAIAAWGAEGHVNDSGVFADYETETVAKSGRAVAEVGIYRLRDGVFVHCCSFMTATSGSSYAPSVWCSTPHESAKQARLTGIAELLERIGDINPAHEKAGQEDVRQLRHQLRREIEQPSLF
jgi:hypothetical protein